ncbi:leucine-rich repeat and immunoglobulin-like domain-containing nogo receptor-interacting protein 4 [Protopterus annectens]|uniref:leucine-rich repeat and immunoglobulin-like domain-containing nogo receptor-interacting protein 4 n=1 Tax=Protopterus annectens TaxID=7888 RepID=UPI001CF9A120|nr:leucine-rich repeat and immunoglobulin-like domain-containing nogo receptor-interacting protein 4 [Protopterus annectens]
MMVVGEIFRSNSRWTSWQSILLIILGMLNLGFIWGCPSKCECSTKNKTAICKQKRLMGLPDGIPKDTLILDLSKNRLKSLSQNVFAGLQQLQELELSENIISYIEPGTFTYLTDLWTLKLRSNKMKIIPAGAFEGLLNLKFLDISQNEIVVFLDHTFKDLTNLRTLEAGDNDLVFISNQAFAGLHNLQWLTMEKCNLTNIPTQALSQLYSLVVLKLRKINISLIQDFAFKGLYSLKVLRLDQWSSLDTFAPNSLYGLNLTSLFITNCNLSSVPYRPLKHLVYLMYLDLSYNPITMIYGNMLSDLLRLREFHLVGGKLVTVSFNAFRGLTYFRLLNVSDNFLTTLEEGAFHSVGNLETLRLDGNPLSCDCRLLWIIRRRRRLNFDGKQPSCNSPANVQGKMFKDFADIVLPPQFTCQKPRIRNKTYRQVTTREGETVTFSCIADGNPVPEIFWMSPKKTLLSATSSGRFWVLRDGTLQIRYAQIQDSGMYLCIANNAGGNDSAQVLLKVADFSLYYGNRTFGNGTYSLGPFPFDAKTLIIAICMGFVSFSASVFLCFIFIFCWSRGKGKIKHSVNIQYVPHGTNMYYEETEDNKFTMKLI